MRVDPGSVSRAPSRIPITASLVFVLAVWALNFLVVKVGPRYLPPLAFASLRVVAAGIFMVLLAPLCPRLPLFRESSDSPSTMEATKVIPSAGKEPVLSFASHQPRITSHDLFVFAYLGLFGVAVNQFCFTLGLRYTNVTHSSLIVGLVPIYTFTLAVLFGVERLTFQKASGTAMAFGGVVILAFSAGVSRHSPTLWGDAITMCGSLGFAVYVVVGKWVAANYNPLTVTTWNFIFGAIVLLPVARYQAHVMELAQNFRMIPWQAWLAIVYTALFSSTLAYLFYFGLLRYLEASQLAAFSRTFCQSPPLVWAYCS